MKTLSNIKKDLEFNRNLFSIIEALKNIAVSQFRTLEQKIKTYEKLTSTVESFFELIDINTVRHPFLNPQNRPQIVVAVTSDSGLLGGLNMQVVVSALRELEKIQGKLVVIGERGKTYAQDYKIPFASFSGIRDEERYAQAMQFRNYVVTEFLKGDYGYLKVIFPRPISFMIQTIETASFLPFAPKTESGYRKLLSEIILESEIEDIVEYLVYLWIGQKLYEIFGLSRLAELSARYVHLEESSQKLKEIDNKTHLEYFRVRHELIDRNMRELFASRLIYGQ